MGGCCPHSTTAICTPVASLYASPQWGALPARRALCEFTWALGLSLRTWASSVARFVGIWKGGSWGALLGKCVPRSIRSSIPFLYTVLLYRSSAPLPCTVPMYRSSTPLLLTVPLHSSSTPLHYTAPLNRSSLPRLYTVTQEAKKQDTRQALYHLLTEHMEALGDEWMAQIRRRLDQYKTGTVVVSKDINRRLLRAMIQKIANPDGTDLVYAAQYLVEKRFETLKIESAQATTKLFTDVCMKCYLSFTTEQQTYNKDLLPLLFADQKDVYEILLGVSALAKKLIVKEYAIRVARNHDPRMDRYCSSTHALVSHD